MHSSRGMTAGGTQVWTAQFGTSASDGSMALMPDGLGSVFVGGNTYGTLGGQPNAGERDGFLTIFDGAGERGWLVQFGTSDHEFVEALAPDFAGGVLLAGRTSGDLGGPNSGSSDVYLARFHNNGDRAWLLQLGTAEWDGADALVADAQGNLFLAGSTWGDLGGNNAGAQDAFFIRFTADCYPDFTGDGTLDLFDFLGYVNAFNDGDNGADCTGEGVLDLFDFLCFVNAFNEGCP
jgi:hypothetical protein